MTDMEAILQSDQEMTLQLKHLYTDVYVSVTTPIKQGYVIHLQHIM
jgi:hypothetical protein